MMRLSSAAGVLLAVVYCTAENNVPRWSKQDSGLGQGEWIPLNNERLNQEPARIPSAINPLQFNHALHSNQNPSQFNVRDFQAKQILASQSAPPRFTFLPQSINAQLPPQQPQLPPQQLLSQFLNQPVAQGNLPGFGRALVPNQQLVNAQFFPQHDNVNFDQYNPLQDFKNSQYTFNNQQNFESPYLDNTKYQEDAKDPSLKALQPSLVNDHLSTNLSSALPNKKEEVQILYVPVEMLKQQEAARNAAKNNLRQEEIPVRHTQPEEVNQQLNNKESRKFRHPIQPLKDQVPAHHLRGAISQGKLLYPTTDLIGKDIALPKETLQNPPQPLRSTPPPRSDYFNKYNRGREGTVAPNKEQYVDESNIQDEVSDFRNTITRRTPAKESRERAPTTLPPPNQPPLSVFMESTESNRIGDVLSLLKDSKTIPVLDSVGPDAPQVFVGPSNLNTPEGYIKFELPYLSSLSGSTPPQKLSQVPFFVAPLNFQPPPGFAKIPFPPPHIGSVVLSNASHHRYRDELSVPTPPSVEHQTANYKETFTIPADISSISPQLPSLINSLQEDEYLGSSSTESLSEPTEEPATKYRRPSSRRQNNRGSQRGYTSSPSTTRKPSSRQRRPPSRYYNQRLNKNSETNLNSPVDDGSTDSSRYHYNSNPRTENLPTSSLSAEDVSNEYVSTESHTASHHLHSNEDEKQDQRNVEHNPGQFNNDYLTRPTALHSYSNHNNQHSHDGSSDVSSFRGRENTQQPSAPNYSDTRTSDAQTYSTNTQGVNYNDASYQKSNENYPQFQHTQTARPIPTFTQQSYQDERHSQPQEVVQENTGSLNSYEELQFKKALKAAGDEPQDVSNHKVNYRIQDQQTNQESNTEAPSLLRTFQEQARLQNNERNHQHQNYNHQQSQNEVPSDRQQGYSGNYDAQNTNLSNENRGDVVNYGGAPSTVASPHQTSNYPQETVTPTEKSTDYESRYEPQHRATERPTSLRSRTRVRGRTHGQTSQNEYTTPGRSYNYRDEDQKLGDRSQQTESNYHTTTEQPSTPNRKYLHTRGRRPLRPTSTTTASPATSTTSAPPGTKYLIRTRRPTVAPTKLHSGRGRIRRPTTPTTTTPAPTTTEYPKTLAPQWRQPAPEEYPVKETISPLYDMEYRPPPQYQEGTSSQISLRNQHREREENYQQRRTHPKTRVEQPQSVPNYSYEAEDDHVTQNQYDATELPQYSTGSFERTSKPHLTREQDATPQPYYTRPYERSPKPHNPRVQEATQRTYVSKEYEDTQKPHYVKEYEATLKPQYTRDYETTQKPYYQRDYETTLKPSFVQYDNTPKPQLYDQREVPQNKQNNRYYDSKLNSQQFQDYKTTVKEPYVNEYATTPKAQTYNDYEITVSPLYEEYETTRKPTVSQEEPVRKTQTHSPTRTSNHKRRPPMITRGEIKNSRYNKPETSTTKNDADFWNQAVTIQQSQSYVYTPDDEQSPVQEESKQHAKTKTGPLHADYDDYYNFQEGTQYTSDQSPFPSNDQLVTYTKSKPNQEIGKANQYPEKSTTEKSILERGKEPETLKENAEVEIGDNRQESTSPQTYEQPPQANDEKDDVPEQPDALEPVNTTSPLPQEVENHKHQGDGTRKKGGKRRGTWVRVRVKKPKDVFETAESQRFSAVNAISEDSLTKGFNNLILSEATSKDLLKNTSNNNSEVESVETTTSTDDARSNDNSGFTTNSEYLSYSENYGTTEASTIADSLMDSEEAPTTTIVGVPQDTTLVQSHDYKTSTTTEISLETEICYKGQCIKTKRKKDRSGIEYPLVK